MNEDPIIGINNNCTEKRLNDTGWLIYGLDYDDDGLQSYFDEPIIKCRFWEFKNKSGLIESSYDVILLSDLELKNDLSFIWIPENKYNIDSGNYSFYPSISGTKTVFDLINEHKNNPDVIKYILDMVQL